MREWNDPWNPFNSAKVLLWRRHLEACAREDYLPPVTVDIDPANVCQLSCQHCNAFDAINREDDMKLLPETHMIAIADFISEWGRDTIEGNPKSACIAGGGEPLVNSGTMGLLERMHHHKLQNGVITNGLLLNKERIKIMSKTCRWVGISVDCATPDTFAKVKGIPNGNIFNRVIENIRQLTKQIENDGTKCDVAYKYLLHPDNAHEIFEAAVLAKSIGCYDFHLRPVGWINIEKTKGKGKLDFSNLENIINAQMKKALELECETFHVYGVRHKFNPDFTAMKNFSRCWTIPMLPTFGADGWVMTCFDMRGREDLRMVKHFPDPWELARYWNTEAHKELIRNINIHKCPRCTWTSYNEIVEKVIIQDKMCLNFP